MELFTYLLKVSACSALFFAFYLVVLRKLTFFKANRFYLLFSLLLSFLIPALHIEIEKVVPAPSVVQPVTVQNIQPVALGQPVIIPPVEQGINWLLWLVVLYACVVLVLMVFALWRLTKLLQHARRYTEHIDGLKLVYKSRGFTNCSFFNYVFIDHESLSTQELQLLLRHEEVHAKQYHSLDKLLMLVAKTVLWFNPIIYFFDRELEQIHEYEADASASQNFGTQSYASLLLRLAIQEHSDALVHNFVKSPIKERIKKLYQSKSKNMKKLSYALALPIATGLVWGFAVNMVYAQEKAVEVRAKTTREVPAVRVQGVRTENITSTGRVEGRKIENTRTAAGIEVVGARTINEVAIVGQTDRVENVSRFNVVGQQLDVATIGSGNSVKNVDVVAKARGVSITGNVNEVRSIGVARGVNVQTINGIGAETIAGTQVGSRNVAKVIEGTGQSLNGVEVTGVRTVGVARSGNSVKEARIEGNGNAKLTNQKAGLYISKEKIVLLIDENTTKQELESYLERLKEKDIILSINKLKFNNNKISYLEIAVNCKNGPSGAASGAPSAKDKIGFYRIYDENAPSNFGIGFNLDPNN